MRILFAIYDNDSYVSWFPQGIAYLASACRNAGHDVHIFSQDVYHWPDEKLTALLDQEHFDLVGVGVIGGYYQYRRLLALSKAINASRQRPFFVIGGHGPSPDPAYYMRKTGADAVVIGEGEVSMVELLDALQGKRTMSSVNGIAYKEHDHVHLTPPRQLIADVDTIALPAWDLFEINHYAQLRNVGASNGDRTLPVLSGRGCTFKCNFCYRMDKGFRPRSPSSILDEIELLQTRYNIRYIDFSDELLMNSEERTITLCEAFMASGLAFKWSCNGRLNYAKPHVLSAMKNAGCQFINYGIESLDDATLKVMNKGLTAKQIERGIVATLDAGISPGFNIIFGNIGETYEALQKGVNFLLKYSDFSQMRTIRPVTPYPGSPLYYHAIENGLLKDCEDFYENKHVNSDLLAVNFTPLDDDAFHHALYEANIKLIESFAEHKKESMLKDAYDLYYRRNVDFRGFRQM